MHFSMNGLLIDYLREREKREGERERMCDKQSL